MPVTLLWKQKQTFDYTIFVAHPLSKRYQLNTYATV